MKWTDLSNEEVALLEQHRKGKQADIAFGYEEGLKPFQTILSTLSLDPQPTRDQFERLLLQEADRALRDAPALAKCETFRKTVGFYAEIHIKRTGKKHNE